MVKLPRMDEGLYQELQRLSDDGLAVRWRRPLKHGRQISIEISLVMRVQKRNG